MTPLLLLALLAAPPDLAKGPPPSELAKIYFIAGDLLRAHDVLRMGQAKDPKAKPMLAALIEYEELVAHSDRLTPAEAKALVADDRLISPLAMGKMTRSVYDRFVATPLLKAKARYDDDLNAEAEQLARQALEIDPHSADARALLAKLGADAGPPADAGR
jgi:hypothetical protein